MKVAKPTIYPTLVIGLGGVGTNIVRHTKKRFLRTWDDQDMRELPSVLQVLSVDTEPLVNPVGETPLYFHEFAFLGKYDATRLVKNKTQHPEIAAWWSWADDDLPLGYIHTGAKQLRPIGRLSFFRNYTVFKTRLVDKLSAMQENAAIKEAQERGFAVAPDYRLIYIVSSLCGGTGSGMFLDVAHRVRQEVGSNANIVGILLMPSIFEKTIPSDLQRRRIRANAYAALKELDHFHRKTDFKVRYPGEQVDIPTTPYRALNQIFLIERTNADGRTLTTKAEVEQMVAHFISLNAFSHLNKRILGLDVNITEEHEQGMSYSSFGVSALVLPRTALRRFFKARVAAEITKAVVFGGMEEKAIRDAAWQRHTELVSQIWNLFTAFTSDIEHTETLVENLDKSEGVWEKFSGEILAARRDLLLRSGIRAAAHMLNYLSITEGQGLIKGMLAHENTFALEAPSEKPVGAISMLFGGGEADRNRNKDIKERQDHYARRIEAWERLYKKIAARASELRNALNELEKTAQAAYAQAMRDATKVGAQVQPLHGGDSIETATYYDLESGAVSEGDLEEYWRRTSELLRAPARLNGNPVQGAPPRFQVLLRSVLENLVSRDNRSLSAVNTAELRLLVEKQLEENPLLRELRVEETKAYDLRTVISMQFTENLRPANYRPDQVVQPTAPHAVLDADTRPHSIEDEEHLRLMSTPGDRGSKGNASDVDRDFERAFDSYRNFDWVPTGNGDRIDVVHVVHGLPVSHLRAIQEMRAQYAGWPKRYTLHVKPEWNDFEEIYIEPGEPVAGEETGAASGKDKSTTDDTQGSAASAAPFADAGPTASTVRP